MVQMLSRMASYSKRRERGQALVEFALIFPLLILIIFIFIEFGIGFARYNEVVNGAREGARSAVVGASRAEVKSSVIAKLPNLSLSTSDVCVTYPDSDGNGTADPGESVVVAVTFQYPTITPLADFANVFTFGAFPTNIEMTASADMRLEQGVGGPLEDPEC
jgi:Flp pilus assembly protein TadG